MLGDMDFFTDVKKMSYAVSDAKELFGANDPYFKEQRLGETVIIFNEHFIRSAREALTTGCMAKMDSAEEQLFLRFIAQQDETTYRDITGDDDDVVEALSQWFVDDVQCNAHPVLNACYSNVQHSWAKCSG